MSDESTEAFATRLPPQLAVPLRAAIDETGAMKSAVLRSAVAHYVRRNPDGLRALAPKGSIDHMLAELEESRE